jgi:hypothetical protein
MKNYIVQLKQLEEKSKYNLINKIIILMLIPHTIWLWAIISADNFATPIEGFFTIIWGFLAPSLLFILSKDIGNLEQLRFQIESVKKFLLETNQEITNKNINILLNNFFEQKEEKDWNKIEDMLYDVIPSSRKPVAKISELFENSN